MQGVASSRLPTIHIIWLEDCTVESEETIRSLVSLCRLNQLQLHNCFSESSGTILEAKELCEYLLSAVSDPSIVNRDNKRPARFPGMCSIVSNMYASPMQIEIGLVIY